MSKENPNAKYMYLQAILDKNWEKRNKENLSHELLLSGVDEQMIYDCMIEYADRETASMHTGNVKLKKDKMELEEQVASLRNQLDQKERDVQDQLYKFEEAVRKQAEEITAAAFTAGYTACQEADRWMPIEDAPKTGEKILGHEKRTGSRYVCFWSLAYGYWRGHGDLFHEPDKFMMMPPNPKY